MKVTDLPSATKAAAPKSAPAKPAKKSYLAGYASTPKVTPEPPLGRVLIDLFIKLAAVLALGYGGLYLLRGWMNRAGSPLSGRHKGHMQTLESLNLGPNRSIHLVRIGRKAMILGSTPDRIVPLAEVDDPETLSEMLGEDAPRLFSDRFDDALSADDLPPANDASEAMSAQVQGGIAHLWDRIQEVRDLRDRKGSSR